jgi:hypothetical protein
MTTPGTVRVNQERFNAARTMYAMLNGRRIRIGTAAGGTVAQIDRQPARHLVTLSPDCYVARVGNVTIDFNPWRQRSRHDDELHAHMRLAQVVVRATIAQR